MLPLTFATGLLFLSKSVELVLVDVRVDVFTCLPSLFVNTQLFTTCRPFQIELSIYSEPNLGDLQSPCVTFAKAVTCPV